jgi:hypothetical protein
VYLGAGPTSFVEVEMVGISCELDLGLLAQPGDTEARSIAMTRVARIVVPLQRLTGG